MTDSIAGSGNSPAELDLFRLSMGKKICWLALLAAVIFLFSGKVIEVIC
jgi:hypothetical protein